MKRAFDIAVLTSQTAFARSAKTILLAAADRFELRLTFRPGEAADNDHTDASALHSAADAWLSGAPIPYELHNSSQLAEEARFVARVHSFRTEPALFTRSPLRADLLNNVDLLVLHPVRNDDGSRNDAARVALQTARSRRRRLICVHEHDPGADTLSAAARDAAKDFPNISIEHVDTGAALCRLLSAPAECDVLLAEPRSALLLSQQAAMLSGVPELAAEALIGMGGGSLFAPSRDSDDAMGAAAAARVAAHLLRHGLKLADEAGALESALSRALFSKGLNTARGDAGRDAMTSALVRSIASAGAWPASRTDFDTDAVLSSWRGA